MSTLVNYLGCGLLMLDKKNPAIYFIVTKFSDLESKIIPFFAKYPPFMVPN